MTDLKCARCGAELLVANQVCNFCAIEMEPAKPPPLSPIGWDAFPRTPLSPTHWDDFPPQPRLVSPPIPGPIRPFNGIGDVLGPTFRLFFDNFWLITKLVFVIVAPLELMKVMTVPNIEDAWQFQTGTFLLQMLSNVIIAPALIFALMKVMQTGIGPGVNQSYRWGIGKLPKLTLCALASWLMAGLGYLLCVIPGIVISVALSLVYPLAVLENRSPAAVLRDSRDLTRGHRWNIFFASLLPFAVIGVMSIVISWPAAFLMETYSFYWAIPLVGIIAHILNQLSTILFLVIYLSIRVTLEGGHAQ